jgi:hypothetical protein
LILRAIFFSGVLFAYKYIKTVRRFTGRKRSAGTLQEVNMKKIVYVVLILTMTAFLLNPMPSEARGGHGWWAPWAVIGGAAVLAAPYYFAPYHYAPYYSPPPVIIREQPPVYIQPAPSVAPSSTERIFVYPRQGQSEAMQAKDRYECHSWAVNQIGYDPTQSSAGDMPEARRNQMRIDYQRAQGACLDGRGYTMK